MTATSPAKRAKSANRLRRFFRGISAAVSLPLIRVDSTPEAVVQPSGPAGEPVFEGGSIPYAGAFTVPLRNRLLHLTKRSRAQFAGSRLQWVLTRKSSFGDKRGRCRYGFHRCGRLRRTSSSKS